mmetsp:Transcript_77101/g.249535  ORF Transcript_77101/g.249535 Transcript_77101/m.249535 type:complete len:239 (+) Transcript_77101:1074-1790(+)
MLRTPWKSPLKPCNGSTTFCTVRAIKTRASPRGSSRYPSWKAGSLKRSLRPCRSLVIVCGVVRTTRICPRSGGQAAILRLATRESSRPVAPAAADPPPAAAAASRAARRALCTSRSVTFSSRLVSATTCAADCESGASAPRPDVRRCTGVLPLARVTASLQAERRSCTPVLGLVKRRWTCWKRLAEPAGKWHSTSRFRKWQRATKASADSSSTFVEYFALASISRLIWPRESFMASTK